VKLTRLFSGDDGESHFDVVDIPLHPGGEIGLLSSPLEVRTLILRETPGDYHYQWHNAPCRQYIVMLEGAVDIEIGSGEVRRFGPGEILLAEDTEGRGHISRAVDGKVRKSLFITLPEEAD